jgi:hypothetical protein
MFVRLYSLTFAGASTGDGGGVVTAGATGGADAADGAVNVIGVTVGAELDAISLDFMRSCTIKTIG